MKVFLSIPPFQISTCVPLYTAAVVVNDGIEVNGQMYQRIDQRMDERTNIWTDWTKLRRGGGVRGG